MMTIREWTYALRRQARRSGNTVHWPGVFVAYADGRVGRYLGCIPDRARAVDHMLRAAAYRSEGCVVACQNALQAARALNQRQSGRLP